MPVWWRTVVLLVWIAANVTAAVLLVRLFRRQEKRVQVWERQYHELRQLAHLHAWQGDRMEHRMREARGLMMLGHWDSVRLVLDVGIHEYADVMQIDPATWKAYPITPVIVSCADPLIKPVKVPGAGG